MTVINPNSISGITSITMPSGDGNVLTIHTNDGVERFRIDSSGNIKVGTAATISPDGDLFVTGVCTATTLSGAASGLTGALPAIDGSALTGIAATDNVRTGILDVAGIVSATSLRGSGALLTGVSAGKFVSETAGIVTNTPVGINTSTVDDKDLTGIGNSFKGLYIGNGMVIHDSELTGTHYIGTSFRGMMAGPVTIGGTLTVDGNYVVV